MISEVLVSSLSKSVKLLVVDAVSKLSSRYGFEVEEGLRVVNLSDEMISVRSSRGSSRGSALKSTYPLPFSGNVKELCCKSLRYTQGLYTQCSNKVENESFCSSCCSKMKDGVPECGSIEDRLRVGVMDYVDPKGRKVVPYTKIMSKYKLSESDVHAEAKRLGETVDSIHFAVPDAKRGRPKADKPAKVNSGVKGRPKKAKKVVEIAGEEDDLFASLVAESVGGLVSESVSEPVAEPVGEPVAEPVSELVSEPVGEPVAEPVAPKAVGKAAKDAEKAAKDAEKAAAKAAKEAEKIAKEAEKTAAKAAKEAEKIAKAAAKEVKSVAKKPVEKKPVEKKSVEQEADVVKKIEFEGKKYLKSKKTGIVYDYDEYVKSGDQIVVGKWNDTTNKLDFQAADSDGEESAEEYEDE
jgi:hypothetical protein